MREIKFRIFYDDAIFIIDESSDFTIEFGNKDAIVNIFCSDGLIDKWKPEAVMQFTGLLDKEGVEIYEGDVIYLSGYGDYTVEFPFIELYEAGFENDIGQILGNIYEHEGLPRR